MSKEIIVLRTAYDDILVVDREAIYIDGEMMGSGFAGTIRYEYILREFAGINIHSSNATDYHREKGSFPSLLRDYEKWNLYGN